MSTQPTHIVEYFLRTVQKNPSKDALLFLKGGAYYSETYLSVYHTSLAFARMLRSLELAPGDRVMVMLENRPEFLRVCFAVLFSGGVIVPLDIQSSSDVVDRLAEHCGAALMISSEKFRAEHERGKAAKLRWICVDSPEVRAAAADGADEGEGEPYGDPVFAPERTAALFYTSGTTAEPKAVMLTHQNLIANVESIRKTGLAVPEDVVISILPLHHTYAFTTTLLFPLLIGMTVAYPKSLASADLLSCIKQTCTTVFVGVPQIFAMIHRAVCDQMNGLGRGKRSLVRAAERMNTFLRKRAGLNIGSQIFRQIHQRFGVSLRLMVSGGARLDPQIAKDFYGWGLTLVEGYGLTETSPVVSFSVPEKPRFGSVGRPLPGVEVRIHEPDEKGEGEILIRGDNVMSGYYRLEEETRHVLKQGWFYTGDIGRLDREGFLFLTGRKKEMLVLSNGENINPEELELHYAQNPFIREIAVLTVPDTKRPVTLTRLVAIIVPDEEHFRAERELNIQKRLRWELENDSVKLPTYKRIRGFVISQEGLPRTRLGKLKRFELEMIYHDLHDGGTGSQTQPAKRPAVYSEPFRFAVRFLETYLGRSVAPDDHLELDLGLDSLGRLELLVALQKHLGLSLEESESQEFFSCSTVQQLLDRLKVVLERHGKSLGDMETSPQGFSDMAKSALSYLEEHAGRSVSLKDHLELDLGLDSLSRVELLLGIQQQLNLSLSEEDAVRFFLCGRVCDLLEELNRLVDGLADQGGVTLDWREILGENPQPAHLKHVQVREMNFFQKAVNAVVLGFFRGVFQLCFRLKVRGLNNLPARGPYLLSANHTNYLDGLFIATALPFPIAFQTFFLGDSQFLDLWLLRPFKRIARLIPIQFNHRMAEAMRVCAYVLRHDRILCYFPEGRRSIDGEVKDFRKGVGILIHELDVPVVPIYIQGAFEVWPRGRRWPRFAQVTVTFGSPVSAKELAFKMTESQDIYQRISDNLRDKVRDLF